VNSAAPPKTVYVNDEPVGEASTWADVNALLVARKILFIARPGRSEGPGGFYVEGSTLAAGAAGQRATERGTSGTARFAEDGQDTSVREIAELLIARYGVRAASHASLQALKARHRGEPRQVEAWEWIANAVASAMRAEEERLERTTFVQNL